MTRRNDSLARPSIRSVILTLFAWLFFFLTAISDGAPFDLQARRAAHWAWQPVQPANPPVIAGAEAQWARSPIDAFILARLKQAGITPAPEVDRRTLIRRVSFALVGLPPTPEEVSAFVEDKTPDAYEKVVDRLLASPHFGERWARHWMDLVRYADTLGNETDATIPNTFRYRDYLIRAFNADVPYDQFVTEHIAGDLLDRPRRTPDGLNESIIATGFFWLNEGKRSPVDVRQAQADCFDNKIDVMCKTFLGLTVGCARCHDHKFDAITQSDYYALYGYLKSSRYTQALVNDQQINARAAELLDQKRRLREAAARMYLEQSAQISRYLLAASQTSSRPADAVAADEGLNVTRLRRWAIALSAPASINHPMFAWQRMAGAEPAAIAPRWRELTEALRVAEASSAASRHRAGDIELSDFARQGYAGWFSEDQSFGKSPSMPGDFLPGTSVDRPVQTFFREGAWAHSATVSHKLQGTLRSPTFTINKKFLHVFAAGRAARVNVNIEHYVMIQDPLYGALRWVPESDGGQWHTFDLSIWQGREAYVEFADTTTPDLHDTAFKGVGKEGYLAVSRVILSDQPAPANVDPPPDAALFRGVTIDSLAALAARYQTIAEDSLAAFARGQLPGKSDADARAQYLSWLLENDLLDATGTELDSEVRGEVAAILAETKQIEDALPDPIRAPATVDGTSEDEYVFLRGNYKNAGPMSPRRMLLAIAGDAQPPAATRGSGRLELARRFVDPSNPFISRVIVNRVWHHLLGRGIVASVDNFGVMGDPPSHPELLDYLANGLVKDGWSLKRLIRRIVLSETFRMSSQSAPDADRLDPDNRLFHRAIVRRMEGEAIRDEILQISGRLNPAMGGPGVEIVLTPFNDNGYVGGYGKPDASGPLDGDGRRSIYMKVRRNFLPAMMVAFDTPPPINTTGRRTVSNVPAQALIMMNDPFVAQQAEQWARRTLADPSQSARQRIARMYEEAFAREPAEDELATALGFIDEHGQELGIPARQREIDPKVWADLAHVLVNVKEFIFLK